MKEECPGNREEWMKELFKLMSYSQNEPMVKQYCICKQYISHFRIRKYVFIKYKLNKSLFSNALIFILTQLSKEKMNLCFIKINLLNSKKIHTFELGLYVSASKLLIFLFFIMNLDSFTKNTKQTNLFKY